MIGRAVLATLLPARRPRYSARRVKCTTGRYHDRDHARPAMPTTITAINITLHTPPLDPVRAPTRPPQPPTRRQHITAIMNSDPNRAWSGRELAESLQVNLHNMLTQLSEWTRLGFLTRTGSGTYALTTPP